MKSVPSLAELAAKSEGKTVTLKAPKKEGGQQGGGKPRGSDVFNDGQYHAVEITEQAVKTTKNGYTQLELARSLIDENGNAHKAGRVWINIPHFSDDVVGKVTNNKINQLTEIYGKALHKLLRAAMPEQFEVFKSIDRSSSPWKYVTRTGEVLTQAQMEERRALIESTIVGAANAIADGSLDLTGSRVYMQEVPSTKDEGQTFLNFAADLPESK